MSLKKTVTMPLPVHSGIGGTSIESHGSPDVALSISLLKGVQEQMTQMDNRLQELTSEIKQMKSIINEIQDCRSPIWTTAVLAQMVGRTEETVRAWVRQKKITAISVPGDKNSYLFIATKVMEELEGYVTQ